MFVFFYIIGFYYWKIYVILIISNILTCPKNLHYFDFESYKIKYQPKMAYFAHFNQNKN